MQHLQRIVGGVTWWERTSLFTKTVIGVLSVLLLLTSLIEGHFYLALFIWWLGGFILPSVILYRLFKGWGVIFGIFAIQTLWGILTFFIVIISTLVS